MENTTITNKASCFETWTQANFVFVNWLAPCTLKSSSQQAQTSFTAHCIMSSEQNFGAVLMPIFTYKKGQLWMLETATVRSLAMSGLNVDHAWHLCFAKKVGDAKNMMLNMLQFFWCFGYLFLGWWYDCVVLWLVVLCFCDLQRHSAGFWLLG